MGILKIIWNYCPRPIKRRRQFFAKIAVSFGISKLENLRVPDKSLFLDIAPLAVSLILLYDGILLLVNFLTNGSLDITFLFKNPLLLVLSLPVFGGIWAVVDLLLRTVRKKGTKVILFAFSMLIILPAAFGVSLNYGMLDSVTLLDDSIIDLSYCTAMLHIKNNGLTEVRISSVEIGELHCNVSYPLLGTIKPGENETLHIYYAYRQFMWGSDGLSPGPSGLEYDSNLPISPTTFREGKYPVIIHTDGVLSYKFEIEAKFSKPEEIYGFQVNIFNLHKESDYSLNCYLPDMALIFNMSQGAVALVYSVEIGNLTLQLVAPPMVQGYEYCNDFYVFLTYNYCIWVSGWPPWLTEGAIPNQPINVPIFKIGETYNVTVRTMANNNYTTQIKMVD